MTACPRCGNSLRWVPEHGRWYCPGEREYLEPAPPPTPVPPPPGGLWFQSQYRIRKKVLAVAQQYWVEDASGRTLAYGRQKLLRIREDIRIFSDETRAQELFRIQQANLADIWGTFYVLDSGSGAAIGSLRRKALASSFAADEWEMFAPNGQLLGGIYEEAGRGVMRKYIPGGRLIPEHVTVTLMGRPVAEIHQRFKIVGDIWDIDCRWAPPTFDRRVLLSCALLMGMIERRH